MAHKIKHRSKSPLQKKARKGFRGYPIATIAFYGPDNRQASKVAVGIIPSEGAEPVTLNRWFLNERDLRTDAGIAQEILAFIERHEAESVVTTEQILGCPHEEGIDYPDGGTCPQCPFWSHRDAGPGRSSSK